MVNKPTTYGDGITYSIQKEESVLKRDSILSTGTRTDSLTTSVKAGERLFFRLQSRYSGAADSVAWSQRVEYSRIVGGNATYLGQDLSHYDAASDFLEGMTTGMSLPKDGRVEVKAPYRKGRTGSHVTLVVRRKDLHGEHILMEKKLPAGTPVEDTFADAFDVLAKDSVQLTFEMLTDAPLEWRNMSWKPTLLHQRHRRNRKGSEVLEAQAARAAPMPARERRRNRWAVRSATRTPTTSLTGW